MFTLENFPYFNFVIVATIFIYVWDTYLNLRQRAKLRETEPSEELLKNELTTKEEFAKSQTYGLDKNSFTLFKDVINLLKQLAFIATGYLYLWNFCGTFTQNIYYHSLLFIISYQIFETLISTPFSWYNHFVIQERHGFNKQTLSIFIKDIIKSTVIITVIIVIIVPPMMWIIDYFGDMFVIYLWVFISVFLLLMMWLAPNIIMPCFYQFEDLDEDKHCKTEKTKGLKVALNTLSDSLSFPLKKIFIMDGSTRSSHSNAFQYGFCSNKHIVLFDTLLTQMSKEEILSVMCHELGHWKYSHTLKGLLLTEVQLFVTFALFKFVYLNRAFYASFDFQFAEPADNVPIIIGLVLFSHLLSPISLVLTFLHNSLTRSWEYQADAFAVELDHGKNLYNALVVLFKENKSKLDPDPLYEAYHHNHPSALPRLKALRAVQQQKERKSN